MNICVFCSCSPVEQHYIDATYELGYKLGKAGSTLVFGAFSDGLMGAVADGFADAEADIIGVAPVFLEDAGRAVHTRCTEVIETGSLAERKNEMINRSDAIVVAPGGIGTLDEVFSVLAMAISGERQIPVVFFDYEGFYDGIIQELMRMEQSGFIRQPVDTFLQVAKTPQEVVSRLQLP